MRTVTYIGRYPAVEIETAPGRWHTVNRGDSIDVGDTLAESLLEQSDNWADGETVPTGTTAEILAWVGDNPDRAAIAVETEQAGKNRSTLITQLEALIEEAANV